MATTNTRSYDFTIYNKIIDYNKYVKQYLTVSIPSNQRDIRIHFLDEIYLLSRNMFSAIYNKGNIRMKYIVEMQINISMLDMMTSELKTQKCISKNHLDSSIKKLSDIKNIVYAWKLNEEDKKKQ